MTEYFHSGRRRFAFSAALFGLLMQILLPLGQAIEFNGANEVGPDRLVICTLYWVKIVDLLSGKEVPDREIDPEKCPVCFAYGIAATSIGVSSDISIEAPRLARVERLPLPTTVDIPASRFFNDCAARAPPSLV